MMPRQWTPNRKVRYIYVAKMKRLGEVGEKLKMAQLLTLRPPLPAVRSVLFTRSESAVPSCYLKTLNPKWASLQQKLKCNGRFSCLFSDNRKQVAHVSLYYFHLQLSFYSVGSLPFGFFPGMNFIDLGW